MPTAITKAFLVSAQKVPLSLLNLELRGLVWLVQTLSSAVRATHLVGAAKTKALRAYIQSVVPRGLRPSQIAVMKIDKASQPTGRRLRHFIWGYLILKIARRVPMSRPHHSRRMVTRIP